MNLEEFGAQTEWKPASLTRLIAWKRQALERQRRQPVAGLRGSVVRIEASKTRFETKADAAKWVRQHGFRGDRYTEHEAHYAFGQRDLLGHESRVPVDEGTVTLVVVRDGQRVTVAGVFRGEP